MNSPTTPLHVTKLPYPRGTLVMDADSGLQGHLTAVIAERLKEKPERIVSETAYVRPVGGGREWSAPLERIRTVEATTPATDTAQARA